MSKNPFRESPFFPSKLWTKEELIEVLGEPTDTSGWQRSEIHVITHDSDGRRVEAPGKPGEVLTWQHGERPQDRCHAIKADYLPTAANDEWILVNTCDQHKHLPHLIDRPDG